MAQAKVFLTLVPVWSRWAHEADGSPKLERIEVGKATKNRPAEASGPVVKLIIDVPDAAFKPLRPVVMIEVPEQALDFEPTALVELPEPQDGD